MVAPEKKGKQNCLGLNGILHINIRKNVFFCVNICAIGSKLPLFLCNRG